MSDINTEINEELLTLCKQMFKNYTNTDVEFCKRIIAIEEKIRALKTAEAETPKKTDKATETPIPVKKEVKPF